MGVKGCFRTGCDNIMCDVYISDIGYICWECEREFKNYLEEKNIEVTTEYEIKRELKKFMDIRKGEHDTEKKTMSVEEFFDKERS